MITVDIPKLKQHLKDNLVFCNKHPEFDLWIYNYTKRCVYERAWDELTIICRGLILDKDYNIIARPFPKFFNYEELNQDTVDFYMKQDFIAYEKMDGCLGIMYFYKGVPYMASRGSFNSDYSNIANKLLQEKYSKYLYRLDKSYTHIFEIIHPKSKIVLDYNNKEELVLLGVLHNTENKEIETTSVYCESLGFPVVDSFLDFKDYDSMKKLDTENKEGYVLKFPDNYRMKIKFENYVRKHSVLSDVSNKAIYRVLAVYGDIDSLISQLPDETHEWCRLVYNDFLQKMYNIKRKTKEIVKGIRDYMEVNDIEPNMKNLAGYLKDNPNIDKMYHGCIFKEWEDRDYDEIIWKRLKPDFLPYSHNLN